MKIQRFQITSVVFALGMGFLLWTPMLVTQGIVFERDPAFFASVQADTSGSLGAFSLQGGVSNIRSQGLFYEPYAAIIWLISHLGLNIGAAGFSKLVPFAMTVVAAWGAYSLSKRFGAGIVGCCFAALFYVFNPWSLDSFGYFYLWTGYCLLPTLVLGTIRIRNGERTPIWLPVAIAFSGGLICWVLAAVVCVLTAVATRGDELRSVGRTIFRLGVNFLGAGAFWIPSYALLVLLPSSQSSLAYSAGGPPLQSSHPLTDLLELRDFWWPHLYLPTYLGILPLAISTLAVVVLVITAISYVTLGSPRLLQSENQSPRLILGSLIVVGLLMGEGTSGLTGWIYEAIRAWPFLGATYIRSITRSPANLALPFVAALGIALSLFITSAKRSPRDSAELTKNGTKQLLFTTGAFLMLAIACAPSLIAFWNVYKPVQIPSTYGELSKVVPKGIPLELAYLPLSAISPVDGLWHYTWNARATADTSLLTASINSPSISPPVDALGQRAVTHWSNATGVAKLKVAARQLGITSLVVEDDIALSTSQRALLDRFLTSLRSGGFAETDIGTETVFKVPGTVRAPIWGKGCKVNTGLFFAGFVHVDCNSSQSGKSAASIVSQFDLPSPMIGIGLNMTKPTKVVDGIGTRFQIKGRSSGWVVFIPNVLATIGGLITALSFLVLVGPRAFSLVLSAIRRYRLGVQ